MLIREWRWEDVSSEGKVEQGWWGWLMHRHSVSIPSESTQSQLLWLPGEEDEKGPGIQGQFGSFRIRDYRFSDFRTIQTFSRTLSP